MSTEFQFLPRGGEMAARIVSFDWGATPLGSPRDWSPTMRSALSLCLGSRFPVVIWLGRDMRMLYNDAYIPFLGPAKHPEVLGRAAEDGWREIWSTIGPMLEGVYRTGDATWTDDGQYFFARDLPREEVYVTFTYGPILAADGRTVEGVFCPCTETTGRVVSARRLAALHQLSARSFEARRVEEACATVASVLSGFAHDVPFALIYRRGAPGTDGAFELLGATGVPDGPARQPAAWPLDEAVRTGQAAAVDLAAHGLVLPGGAWPEAAAAARIVPLHWSGDGEVAGVAVLGVSPRRPLDGDYTAFLDLVGGHAGTAVANALAYEQERRRAESLAQIDRAKTAFFSNVSHELRTPLTLIRGPLEDALAAPGDAWPPERVQMMHRNAMRLQKLVNGLLDFSRIEAGRMQARCEPTDLAQLTAELASVFRSAIEAAGLRLEVDCPPLDRPVLVDPDMYEKIVSNLLSNAFKFTLEGTIAVRLRETGAGVALSVRDTGAGIAARDLAQVFERFHRIEGTPARSSEGTGIGLALVRELTQLHGGSVSVRSEEGAGSVFTVVLPRDAGLLRHDRPGTAAIPAGPPAPADAPGTATGAAQHLDEWRRWLPAGAPPQDGAGALTGAADGRARILWADDNADMRDYVQRLLEPAYAVEAVADGEAALARIRATLPDLVLVDAMMPRLDGFGLLRALRADPRTQGLPVILLSARAGEEAEVGGLAIGADDYIRKPFSARELRARVDAHVRLARERARTAETLREADRRKDEFLATLAHELRNPLAPIRDGVQVLKGAGGDAATVAAVQEMLERQVHHLVRLVDDLLELSRITQGKTTLRIERTDLAAVLRNAVETSRASVDARGHRLAIDGPGEAVAVDGDPVRLTQVFANLLNNAAQYMDDGGRIGLTVRREAGQVVVRVRDAGIGIAPTLLDQVFEPFIQAERTGLRNPGGLGIGLALVRRLVALHGGTVEARSAGPGQGSEFIVRLPVAAAPPPAAAPVAPPAGPDTADLGRVLLVDDNRDAARSLGLLLRAMGADVRVVHDGAAALQALDACRPDAVLLDLGMPGMDGYELARRVRASPEHAGTVLVAVSGWGHAEHRRRSEAAGIDHHLVKPADAGALRALLQRARARRAAAVPDRVQDR